MRDVMIFLLVTAGCLAALRRPWIGIITWTWLSIMNPHRYAFGWTHDAPLAQAVAVATLVGLLLTRDRDWPIKGTPVKWFALFLVWITISWQMGLDPGGDYPQWSKVMKVNFMILVTLALFRSKLQILVLAWVTVGSLAVLGAKGGLFTLMTGGSYRVWGPPDSFIADNNEFALAIVVTIPLLRFLQLQVSNGWTRHTITLVMVLCAAAALGSHSRGSFLALMAMGLALWWRGNSRIVGGVFFVLVAAALIGFMPDSWSDRMATVQSYSEDRSAMGRISAWWNAWNLAFHYPFGVGFDAGRPELFARFSPYPDYVHAAHSIYFQVLGNHGFIGLAIYLAMWVSTWRSATWLRREGVKAPELRWCADLGNLSQVSLLGFAVGGAFLSLSYFDLPYLLMAMVVLARVWIQSRQWETEPVMSALWFARALGVTPAAKPQ
jgi:probable O-glycosylation ligase (exosortase A-associated)